VLVISFLTFKGDGDTIRKFKVGMCVWDDVSILEEVNIPHAKLFHLKCSACETLRYSQDLNAKNMPNPVSWMMAWSSSESCCLARADMTNMGIAF
jgi:hypothetical protein